MAEFLPYGRQTIEDDDVAAVAEALRADAGTIELEVDPIVLAQRRKHWAPRQIDFGSGALWKFAQGVGPAYLGAVTHPGFKGERKVYADI